MPIQSEPSFFCGYSGTQDNQRNWIACKWINQHSWSTPSNIQTLVGTRRSIISDLLKEGFVEEHRTQPNRENTRGYPKKVLSLTNAGYQFLEVNGEIEFGQTHFVMPAARTLRHDALAQFITARELQKGIITDFKTPQVLRMTLGVNEKLPDMALIKGDEMTALEMELSQKSTVNTIEVINKSILTLRLHGGQYSSIKIISDNENIYQTYFWSLNCKPENILQVPPTLLGSVQAIQAGIQLTPEERACVRCHFLDF